MTDETMSAFEKNMATVRGEAMGATILAHAAINAVFAFAPHKAELLSYMNAFIEDSLNMSGPGKGDPHDAHNTRVREIARGMAQQTLDHIARTLQLAKGNNSARN